MFAQRSIQDRQAEHNDRTKSCGSPPCDTIDQDLPFFGHLPKRKATRWFQSIEDEDEFVQRILSQQKAKNHQQDIIGSKPSPSSNESEPLIPLRIHFVWLGKSIIPGQDESGWNDCMKSWRLHNPSCTVQIWRDADILSLGQHLNKEAFEYAMKEECYGMASDIVRLEILYRHGGLYVDCDYVCVDSVENFHRLYDFYCGASNSKMIEVNNGILGSQKGHALLSKMRKEIHQWFQDNKSLLDVYDLVGKSKDNASNSLSLLSSLIENFPRLALTEMVIEKTGPGLLTRSLSSFLSSSSCGTKEKTRVFPAQVFHPLDNTHRRECTGAEMLKASAIPGVTKAIHLWSCSWINEDVVGPNAEASAKIDNLGDE